MSQSHSTPQRAEDPAQQSATPAHTFHRIAPGATGTAILSEASARLGLTRTIRHTLGDGGLWGPGSRDSRFPRRYGGTCNFMGN